MMKNKYLVILPILTLAITNSLIWNFIPTSLNNEFLELSGEIYEIRTDRFEIIKYGVISFLITVVIYLPFYQNKDFKSRNQKLMGFLFITLIFTASGYFLDQNVKGIYLVKYMGDDFPFITKIIGYFLFFPIVLYYLTTVLIHKTKKRNIIGFFFIGLMSAFLSYQENGNFMLLSISSFRKVIAEGHFLFWITLFLGIQFWSISHLQILKNE